MYKFGSLLVNLIISLALAQSIWAGNTATRWVNQAFDAVRATNTSTPRAGRVYAMTTVGMYDAVNGIDQAAGNSTREQALVPFSAAPSSGNRNAAAAAAAHAILLALIPARQAQLDAALAAELAPLDDSDGSVTLGRNWGRYVGEQVVAIRSNDETAVAETQPGGMGPGVFPRPFANAQFRNMQPFGVSTIAPYISMGPPALSSEQYAIDLNEVKTLGSSTDNNPERANIARHWLAEANTVRETGLWLKASLNIVEDQGTVESLSDTARLFALLGMATADTVAVSWNSKFHYQFWRPGDAIRGAGTDQNPMTESDANWLPRGATAASCPFPFNCFGGTPEHTSGTSTFAGASAEVLAGFYCTDHIAFSFVGENGTTRSYRGFKSAAKEAGRSRIYGGIHFEFSNVAGREAGKSLGKEIMRTRLKAPGYCH